MVKVQMVMAEEVTEKVSDVKNEGGRILDITPFAMKFNRKTGEYVVTKYNVVSMH